MRQKELESGVEKIAVWYSEESSVGELAASFSSLASSLPSSEMPVVNGIDTLLQ